MSEPIVYIDQSVIRDGKLGDVKRAVRDLVDFVETHEERIIAYSFYFNEQGTRMTLWQVHPDSASLEYHMDVAGPAFAPFVDLIELSSIEVYGNPSPRLLEQLHRKARMLGNAAVTVHSLQAGFARLPALIASP